MSVSMAIKVFVYLSILKHFQWFYFIVFNFLLSSSTKTKTDSISRLKFTHLIHIRVLPRISENVKSCVDVVEQVDDFNGSLCWCMFAAECIEANNATKKNCHVVVSFSRHRPLMPQFIGYRRRQNRVQQPEKKRYYYLHVHSLKNNICSLNSMSLNKR